MDPGALWTRSAALLAGLVILGVVPWAVGAATILMAIF